MENRIRTMSCNLSNRYLKIAFNELRSTIADHQAPSWVQLYFLVELCRKTIEELKINPPILKDYYSCSIVNTTGPKDFLICTLEVIEEALNVNAVGSPILLWNGKNRSYSQLPFRLSVNTLD